MNLVNNLPEQFSEFENSLNGDAKFSFHQKRKAAVEDYQKNGFPSSALEEWKYTDPSVIRQKGYPLFSAKDAEKSSDLRDNQITVIDGYFAGCGKLPEGLICTTLKEAQKSGGNNLALIDQHLARHAETSESFVALNTALLADALVLIVPEGKAVSQTVEILNISSQKSSEKTILPRILVIAEKNSEIKIVEKFKAENSANKNFINAVLEFSVAEDARVSHYRVQNEASECLFVSTIAASLSDKATFSTYTFTFGGQLVRNHVNVVLNGSDCNVTMNGLTAINKKQHVDNQTLLDNAKPNCQSLELYKGIYADSSQGVFSGSIIVRPDAQKTNAIQSNRSLLLSDSAAVNTKPQLKIWADDVKCTHGATIGQLEDDAMFYLKSRGISDKDARDMLIHAFASEIISAVSLDALKEELEDLLLKKLAGN